jgi:hypothetical protein
MRSPPPTAMEPMAILNSPRSPRLGA